MIATPASEFALEPPDTVSAVSLKFALNSVDTVLTVTEPVAVSSAFEASVALPLATGASFTEVTLWESTTVAVLNAVVPPLVATFSVAAVVTVVLESISSAVIAGAGPLKLLAGRKRRLSALFKVNEVEAALTVASAVQVDPSDVYCQVPLVGSAV